MGYAWDKKLKQLGSVKDEWGGIDKKILNLVVALNLSGIKTSISCSGHAIKGSPFPYVTFRGSRFRVEKLIREFYKEHKPKESARIKIYKGKAGFWLYSGKGFLAWKKAMNKRAEKIAQGKAVTKVAPTKKERSVLPVYQKEMAGFATFLKKNF